MERQPKVLIAISDSHTPQEGEGLSLHLKSKSADKLKKYTITPVFATSQMTQQEQDDLYAMTSGILIPGGGDVDPQLYGQDPHPKLMKQNRELDLMQIRLAKKAFEDKKPVLGICRGAQVLAVAHGGTLIQHLPDDTRFNHDEEAHGVALHEMPDPIYPSSKYHDVIIQPDTKAHKIFSTDRLIDVPSRHHQAIDNPGSLTISGRSPGGIIEIVEHPEHPFQVGIQAHPELVDNLDALFSAFAKAVVVFDANCNREAN